MQDGNIHCHIDNLSRLGGENGPRLAVASAAYVSGQRLWSEAGQRFVDFGIREDVVFSEIMLPGAAPEWARDRAALWNRVDLSVPRKDARLAKTVVAAITRDIPAAQRVELLRAFAVPFVALGCVADVAIHEDGTDRNPHVHLLLTTRHLTADGFGKKIVALDQRSLVKEVRKRWADLSNHFLEKAGSAVRVDHRSYKARGIEAEPNVHRGPNELERREKREHARRAREEQSMPKPDPRERREYPLLAARETWPPEPAPSPDMTLQERDEHHRYWQDRKMDRLEEQYRAEPERPWYAQALDRAQAEAGRSPGLADFGQDEGPTPETARDHRRERHDYDAGVRERALAMKHTHLEIDVLAATRHESHDVRRFVQDYILHERMQTIRDRDFAERLERVQPDIREKLEALRPRFPDWEREMPVPGPERELLSYHERELARERMLDDYLRSEPERKEYDR